MIITPHLAGKTVRVRLSNRFGTGSVTFSAVSLARRRSGAQLIPASSRIVRFDGRSRVTVPAGREVISDRLRFKVRPFHDLAVSVFIAGEDRAPTEHFTARQTSYLTLPRAGDHAADPSSAAFAQTTTARYFVDGLDVIAPADDGAVVTFGDSITDGYQAPVNHSPEVQSTLNTNGRYPDDLQRRLDSAGIPLSVLNAGISGNRLLRGAYTPFFGPSGLARFRQDALAQPGISDVIVLLGINDIGLTPGLTPQQLIKGYKQLIAEAHRSGVKIQLGTLTPSGSSTQPGYGSAHANALRTAVNFWIRGQRLSDGVVDFDAAVRDPDDPANIAPAYDGGDGLHFDLAGYRAMADAIHLGRLGRSTCPRPRLQHRVHRQIGAPS